MVLSLSQARGSGSRRRPGPSPTRASVREPPGLVKSFPAGMDGSTDKRVIRRPAATGCLRFIAAAPGCLHSFSPGSLPPWPSVALRVSTPSVRRRLMRDPRTHATRASRVAKRPSSLITHHLSLVAHHSKTKPRSFLRDRDFTIHAGSGGFAGGRKSRRAAAAPAISGPGARSTPDNREADRGWRPTGTAEAHRWCRT
jgi:hypothetical protein